MSTWSYIRTSGGPVEVDKARMIFAVGKRAAFHESIWVRIKYAPKEVTYEMDVDEWNEVDRPGLKPLLLSGKTKLRKLSMSIPLFGDSLDDVSRAHQASSPTGESSDYNVSFIMDKLRDIAKSNLPVELLYDEWTNGIMWQITSLTFDSEERTAGYYNDITKATAHIELTEWIDFDLNFTGKLIPSSFSVKSGVDTCMKIAMFYNQNAKYAKKIADANGISGLYLVLKVGRVVKLPTP